MTNGLMAGQRPSPENSIAIASAAIGIISAIAGGSLGYDHAKSAYVAVHGSAAGFSDYLEVGQAFWDALPISAAVAVIVGLLAAGQRVSEAMFRYGAGLVGVAALAIGSNVDPARHLVAYQRTVLLNTPDSVRLLEVWLEVYGPLAGILGAIGGAGIGYAVGTKVAEHLFPPK
jgi:hypothetical protein